MQPLYFVADSFSKAKEQIHNYCEQIPRPFNVSFNEETFSIEVDRNLKTRAEQEGGGGLEFWIMAKKVSSPDMYKWLTFLYLYARFLPAKQIESESI